MNDREFNYFNTLSDLFADPLTTEIFISFEAYSLQDPSNLVSQIDTSEFPLVLCAFLEAGHYTADTAEKHYSYFAPPSLEEVERILQEYNGEIPRFLELSSSFNGYFSNYTVHSRFLIPEKRMIRLRRNA